MGFISLHYYDGLRQEELISHQWKARFSCGGDITVNLMHHR